MTTDTRPAVLIVDDERNTREGLARALKRQYRVFIAEGGDAALTFLDHTPVDVLLTDVRMPGMDGLTLMRRVLTRDPAPVCILLTAYGNVDLAVDAMKNGAYDFLTKPVNLDRLELVLKRALRARDVEAENHSLRQQLDQQFGVENMIGKSPAMQQVFETVQQVAPTRATVLITGESGTGKELVARALHKLSPRHNNAFVPVHCAALPEQLLASELFGHEKGAFTGATELRKGRFERADGGSLFLDEIGEIDPSTQVKILRVLEERKFERVGGQETLEVDVRLIAATNRNLLSMVEEGDFREDLYFRLNVVEIVMPPLRERPADVPLLAAHFLVRYADENARQLSGFTPDAMEALSAYDWPGNIRELRNVVERMVVLSRGDKITLRDVPAHLKSHSAREGDVLASGLSMRQAEKQLILNALKDNDNNRTLAAQQLGISRRTLHRKLAELGLRKNRSRKREPGE